MDDYTGVCFIVNWFMASIRNDVHAIYSIRMLTRFHAKEPWKYVLIILKLNTVSDNGTVPNNQQPITSHRDYKDAWHHIKSFDHDP